MPSADSLAPITPAEAQSLFGALSEFPALILAVSGGPDSTALLILAARWREALKSAPKLVSITVDHGLRPEARGEAAAVKRLAQSLGVEHRTLRWTGPKPKAGLQEAARNVRYRLLADAARKVGARHVLTAHTLDDQAETVLMRLVRGSGISGLAGMGLVGAPPFKEAGGILLVRPLLRVTKARLIATLKAAKVVYANDPTNRDPQFTRSRLRTLMPALAREGLTAERLVLLARRVEWVEDALWHAVNDAQTKVSPKGWSTENPVTMEVGAYADLPPEVRLRLLGRAIALKGDEGPVELGKLESLNEALSEPLDAAVDGLTHLVRFRRTLAGALVTLSPDRLTIERAPARRSSAAPKRP